MINHLKQRVVARTSAYTVNPYVDRTGTVFTNRGATASVTFTLPTANAGLTGFWYEFRVHADQSLIVAAAAANTLHTIGDVAADNVGFQTAGKKVGRSLVVKCDGTQWHATPFGVDGFAVDGTEFRATGGLITKSVRLTENGAGTSYVGTIPIPAGAVLHDIKVIAEVLWNGTSAALDVGDTTDPNGFFAAVNLKATDLLVGEVLSLAHGDLWGGKNGAYLVAATGQRGPQTANPGLSYLAGSNIIATVTPGAADGSAGRTLVVVEYSVPEAIAQVAT